MSVILLSLALSAVYCFAAWHCTRQLPAMRRRLVQSLLLSLLCPSFVAQEDGFGFEPLLFYLLFGLGGLKPNEIEGLFLQILVVWSVVFGLWLAAIGLLSEHSDDPAKMNRIKLTAVICSLPPWVLVTGFSVYRFWLDGQDWPIVDFMLAPCGLCVVSSMASVTMFLISMSPQSVHWSDIFWIFWSIIPFLFSAAMGCAFLLSFGD